MKRFKGKSPKILVIGDLMIDNYLWGECERISPEAPVQIVNINNESTLLGAAGNVISNLRAFGAKVDVISVIGDCETSKELKALLKRIKVNTKNLIIQKDRITSKKSRIIASQQQVVRYDRESIDEISVLSQKKLLNIYKNIITDYDNVLLSDYGKGVLTKQLTNSLISIAKKHNKKVLVDPKGFDFSKYRGAYLLTPNKKEASEATGIQITDNKSLDKAITHLKAKLSLEISLITLSEQGVAIYDNNLRIHPTVAREVFDVTGAGDTVLASLGFAIASNYEIDEAVEFANLAAGLVVGKIGSATASIEEINQYEDSLKRPAIDKKIINLDQIALISKDLRSSDKKVIFTNGCFDVLHAGHVYYLETAKSYGDILIVGINSDRSVTALKGINRPINLQHDRAYLLAAIEVVDYVIIFDEDTPYNLIKAVKPNILVKGGDYKDKHVVGKDIVEELKLVEFIDGKSTTNTIKKMHNAKMKVN